MYLEPGFMPLQEVIYSEGEPWEVFCDHVVKGSTPCMNYLMTNVSTDSCLLGWFQGTPGSLRLNNQHSFMCCCLLRID